MSPAVLLDTGPLVAFLDRRDAYHRWATEQFGRIDAFLTCEAVLAEACHLPRKIDGGPVTVLDLKARGVLSVPFRLDDEADTVAVLMRKYADVPMSLADACLVRMAEQHDRARVLTTDGDFRIYRKHGRRAIPVILPKP